MGGNRKNETVIVTHPANGIRFVDGAGISETGGPSPVVTATVAFDDVFTDGEIRGVVSDKSPEKATIVLKESSRTDKVTILNVNLEARDSDMTIKTATTSITVSTSTTGTVFRTARLYVGNTLLKTKTVSGTGLTEVIVFDDVNYKLSKDVEREFRVEVDFNRADTIGLNKLPATFTVNAFGVVSENKNFNAHGETVPVGETHDLIVEGLVATHKSVTSSAVNDGKDVTITFKMDVTAYEKDFYINENGSNAFTYTITGPGATTTVATSTISVSGVTKNTSNNFRIQKGQTREVTVSFLVRSSAGGFVQATLDTLKYAATSTATTFPLTDTLGAPDFKVNNVSIVATPGL
jgi:hypothetical protein